MGYRIEIGVKCFCIKFGSHQRVHFLGIDISHDFESIGIELRFGYDLPDQDPVVDYLVFFGRGHVVIGNGRPQGQQIGAFFDPFAAQRDGKSRRGFLSSLDRQRFASFESHIFQRKQRQFCVTLFVFVVFVHKRCVRIDRNRYVCGCGLGQLVEHGVCGRLFFAEFECRNLIGRFFPAQHSADVCKVVLAGNIPGRAGKVLGVARGHRCERKAKCRSAQQTCYFIHVFHSSRFTVYSCLLSCGISTEVFHFRSVCATASFPYCDQSLMMFPDPSLNFQ